MDSRWRTIRCPSCGGHGVTAAYDADLFVYPEECGTCAGSGWLYIRPKGHLFLWPGGPAAGMCDADAYEKEAQPIL